VKKEIKENQEVKTQVIDPKPIADDPAMKPVL
jgi:hypothetical protein